MPIRDAFKQVLDLRCDDAARLVSESHERKLSLFERVGLRLHLGICSGCRQVQRHLETIQNAARRLAGAPPLSDDDAVASRNRIAEKLRDQLND